MGTVRSAALAFLSASLLIGLSTRAEDPLPLVQPKSAPPVAETPQASSGADVLAMPQVVLAVDSLHDLAAFAAIVTIDTSDPSALRAILREAAVANDQPRFDAALARAKSVAETLPAGDERTALRQAVSVYSDLQQVWSFAATDRYGAFYDDQSLPGLHARLANNYNGYASYIAQYSLTDDNGRVFYPTAETRAFVLRQTGGSVPQIALHRAPATAHSAEPESPPSPHSTATTPAAAPAPSVPAAHHKRVNKAESTPQPAAKTVVKTAAKATPTPVNAAAAKAASTAIAQAPAPVPALVPSGNRPIVPPDALTADMRRAANPPAPPATPPRPLEASAAASSQQTQGLLFIIIALVTIGVMTIWARTPQAESQPPQIFKPAEPLASGESPSPKPEAEVVRIKQNRAS